MPQIKEIIKIDNIRLDIYLTKIIPNYSRNQVKELFNQNLVLINGKEAKPSYIVNMNDELLVLHLLKELLITPKNLNLEIIYEDDVIMIINKPKGLLTHPAQSSNEDSVVNHLLYHTADLSDVNGEERRGIVHRLDKETSGLLIITKTNHAHESLSLQFKNREVVKSYQTIVHNNFEEENGTINAPILRDPITKVKMIVSKLGKEALTHFKVLKQTAGYSFLNIDLVTGRTHQIRVHLSFINHPLIGDKTYGINDNFSDGFYLHANYLKFRHPQTNEDLEFEVELPKDFINQLNLLFE